MRALLDVGMRRSGRRAGRLAGAVSAGCAALVVSRGAYAVTPVSFTGTPYAEDFNALPSQPGAFGPFAGNGPFDLPNATPAGWSFGRISGTQDLQFVVGDGSSTALGLVASMGVAGDADRALGSASTTAAVARYGLTLVNNSQQTFNQFTIQFANEQWRAGGGTQGSSNTFAYAVGANATDINNGTFTPVAGLHVGSIAQSTTAAANDGNAEAFRRVKSGTVNGVSWKPGESLFLRWDDNNAPAAEDWLAMDDFVFSAIVVRTLQWNTNSGSWNTDPANTVWLDTGAASTPASFQNGDNVIFSEISADSTVTIDPAGVGTTLTTINHNSNKYTFTGGPITSGALTKTGTGHVVFAGANTYAGGANLSGGSVETQTDGALGTGALGFTDTTWKVTTNPQTYDNAIAFGGTTTIEAAQPLTLGDAAITGPATAKLIFDNTSGTALIVPNMVGYAGAVEAIAGTIKASSTDGDLFSNTTVLRIAPGATVDFSANGDSIGGLEGSGTLAVGDIETSGESFVNFNAAGDRTFSGIVTGTGGNGFIQRGGGVFTLTGPSTFTTQTIVENGAIAAGADVLPDVAGPLGQNATAIALGALGGSGSGSPSLLIAGPFQIARPVAVSANTNGGAVTLGGNTDDTSRFTGPITLAKTTQLTSVATTGTNAVVFSGEISSPAQPGAGITKVGNGRVVLSGVNTYTGPTLVIRGTLTVSGSIAQSQSVTTSLAGIFEVAASQSVKSLTLEDGTVARIVPGGTPKVLKTGALTLAESVLLDVADGGLAVDYEAGNSPAESIRSAIISGRADGTWNGLGIQSSVAAATPARAVGYGEAAQVLGATGGDFMGTPVDGDTFLARYTVVGDATLDGRVGFADLVALAQNYNTNTGDVPWNRGDFTYDGNVDFGDLVALAQNYNSALPLAAIPGAPAGFDEELARAFAQVPEPGMLAMIGAAAAALSLRGRRARILGGPTL
jgi:autotransporter-associated beta strand protein